jgi:hypothetical protein
MRTRSLLEQHGRQAKRGDRLARHDALERELPERRRDEDTQPTIRRQDLPLRHRASVMLPHRNR